MKEIYKGKKIAEIYELDYSDMTIKKAKEGLEVGDYKISECELTAGDNECACAMRGHMVYLNKIKERVSVEEIIIADNRDRIFMVNKPQYIQDANTVQSKKEAEEQLKLHEDFPFLDLDIHQLTIDSPLDFDRIRIFLETIKNILKSEMSDTLIIFSLLTSHGVRMDNAIECIEKIASLNSIYSFFIENEADFFKAPFTQLRSKVSDKVLPYVISLHGLIYDTKSWNMLKERYEIPTTYKAGLTKTNIFNLSTKTISDFVELDGYKNELFMILINPYLRDLDSGNNILMIKSLSSGKTITTTSDLDVVNSFGFDIISVENEKTRDNFDPIRFLSNLKNDIKVSSLSETHRFKLLLEVSKICDEYQEMKHTKKVHGKLMKDN